MISNERKVGLIPRLFVQGKWGPKEYALLVTDKRSILVLEKESKASIGGALGGAAGALIAGAAAKSRSFDYGQADPQKDLLFAAAPAISAPAAPPKAPPMLALDSFSSTRMERLSVTRSAYSLGPHFPWTNSRGISPTLRSFEIMFSTRPWFQATPSIYFCLAEPVRFFGTRLARNVAGSDILPSNRRWRRREGSNL